MEDVNLTLVSGSFLSMSKSSGGPVDPSLWGLLQQPNVCAKLSFQLLNLCLYCCDIVSGCVVWSMTGTV